MRILITAGPTREALDPVRYLSNHSSGKMGFAIAAAAVTAGHEVVLIHGPVALRAPKGLRDCIAIESAAEMRAAAVERFPAMDVAIMVAAVADFRPRHQSPTKLKSDKAGMTLELVATADICSELGCMKRAGQFLVGFALETDDPDHQLARAKLARKRCDLIVANDPSTLSADRATLEIIDGGGSIARYSGAKRAVARRLVALIEARISAIR